jgi:hypothetical protein
VASVLVLTFAGALACGPRMEQFGLSADEAAFLNDTAAAKAACRPPASANTRAGFASWASRLRYRNIPWKARARGFTPPSGRSVRVEITSPARDRPEVAEGCVIGRIVATYRDSAFGFIDGITYIWADSSSPNSVHLVPEDGTSAMIGYNLTTEPYVSGDEPTLAAGTPSKHICEQCARNDWCVYPRDGFRVEEPASPDISQTVDPE